MCYNSIVINPRRTAIDNIIAEYHRYYESNPHGSFALVRNDGKIDKIRTMNKNEFFDFLHQYKTAEFMHVHLRASSSGIIDEGNIHGFEVCNSYITHNGIVGSYTCQYQDNEKSDTRQMIEDSKFQQALNNAWGGQMNSLKDYLHASEFMGILMVNDKDISKCLFVARNKSLKIYSYNDTLIFSNEFLNLHTKKYGFKFDTASTSMKDCIFIYDIAHKNITGYSEITSYYDLYYNLYYSNSWSKWLHRRKLTHNWEQT